VEKKGLRYIEPEDADLLFDPFSLQFEHQRPRRAC
jgi:hypothetical protein